MPGTECRVLGVVSGNVAPAGGQFAVSVARRPSTQRLLEQANAAWAKLTPEQRALTPDVVIKDKSLWPAMVTVTEVQDFGKFQIKAGAKRCPCCSSRRSRNWLWQERGRLKARRYPYR